MSSQFLKGTLRLQAIEAVGVDGGRAEDMIINRHQARVEDLGEDGIWVQAWVRVPEETETEIHEAIEALTNGPA